jgi:glycerol-3-phosphate dehydrogenase
MGVHAASANADAYELQVSEEGSAWEVAYLQSPAHNTNGHDRPSPRARMSSEQANLLLHDFLQERWKGLVPILWGQQLKQERLDELIYLSLMNADHLPVGNKQSPLTEFFRTDTTPNENLEKPHG